MQTFSNMLHRSILISHRLGLYSKTKSVLITSMLKRVGFLVFGRITLWYKLGPMAECPGLIIQSINNQSTKIDALFLCYWLWDIMPGR